MHTEAQEGRALHTVDEIRNAYDAQAEESYRKKLENPFFERYGRAVGRVLAELKPTGLLDAGYGDGVVLSHALKEITPGLYLCGVDISWERIKIAKKHLGMSPVHHHYGRLHKTGYQSLSFDVVFTSHAMEPNGGREVEILREFARVAKRYVVLFEPDYDAAPPEGKARMERLNYVRNIRGAIREVGLTVERDEPFSEIGNPLNPTNVWVLRK